MNLLGLRKDSDDEGPCVPMARKCAPHSPRTTMKMGSLVGEGRCTDIIDMCVYILYIYMIYIYKIYIYIVYSIYISYMYTSYYVLFSYFPAAIWTDMYKRINTSRMLSKRRTFKQKTHSQVKTLRTTESQSQKHRYNKTPEMTKHRNATEIHSCWQCQKKMTFLITINHHLSTIST